MSELATIPDKKPVLATVAGVVPQTMGEMFRLATAIHNSGMAPKGFNTPEAVMVAMQFGMEVGLSPMQAVHSVAIINGRPSMWGDACLALCMGRPDFEDITETVDRDEATCIVKRRGRSAVTRTFSMADAKRAGLTGKAGPWTQYPQRMLQLRARGFALRDAFPDALRGIVAREEAHDSQREEKEVKHAKLIMPDEAPHLAETLSGEVKDINPATGEFQLGGGK